MSIRLSVLFIIIALGVCSCGESKFPNQARIVEHFEESRHAFGAIVKYYQAYPDVEMTDFSLDSESVCVIRKNDDVCTEENDETLFALLKETKSASILRVDNGVLFSGGFEYIGNTRFDAAILYGAAEIELPFCNQGGFSELRDGACAIEIESEWRLVYEWFDEGDSN